ncbi:MAG: hypothetical protein LBJ44_04065 [Propionibacteriaceae bacterium]|jgi:hypothetical protein|nr:hypothetical protein [Propionibacteriaceae bacterium]
MTSSKPTWRLILLAGLTGLVGLAGCSSDPAPEPPDAPSTALTPSEEPTPTGPQPAAYDPFWTENQLAAVEAVRAYQVVLDKYYQGEMEVDEVLDLDAIWWVAVDPALTEIRPYLLQYSASGKHETGDVVVTGWNVSPETTTADGAQQVTVWACEDISASRLLDADGQDITPTDGHPIGHDYTVQWVPDRSAWLVVLTRTPDLNQAC